MQKFCIVHADASQCLTRPATPKDWIRSICELGLVLGGVASVFGGLRELRFLGPVLFFQNLVQFDINDLFMNFSIMQLLTAGSCPDSCHFPILLHLGSISSRFSTLLLPGSGGPNRHSNDDDTGTVLSVLLPWVRAV